MKVLLSKWDCFLATLYVMMNTMYLGLISSYFFYLSYVSKVDTISPLLIGILINIGAIVNLSYSYKYLDNDYHIITEVDINNFHAYFLVNGVFAIAPFFLIAFFGLLGTPTNEENYVIVKLVALGSLFISIISTYLEVRSLKNVINNYEKYSK